MSRQSRLLLWLVLGLSVAGVFLAFYLAENAGVNMTPVGSLPAIFWAYLALAMVSAAVFFYSLSRLFHQQSRRNLVVLTALIGGINVVFTLGQISNEGWLGRDVLALGMGVAVLVVAVIFAVEPA
jgi:hypothetical protein